MYKNYWRIENTLDIIKLCIKYKCILFESDTTDILPLLDFIKNISAIKFNYKVINRKDLYVNSSSSSDYMITFNI